MKRLTFTLFILSTNVRMGFGQNIQIAQVAYETLVTWFNPHMGNAYMHYPLLGSAKVSDYTIEDGKLISYTHKYKTESNGWDCYITTKSEHHIQYSDSTIIVSCKHRNIGDRTGLRDTTSHSHSFSIADISFVSDSTFMVSKYKWILIADKGHWSNRTKTEEDLWNIEVVFEKSFPVKIKRGEEVMLFNYLKYDKFGNWIEREIVYEDGGSRIQTRSIEYSCESCGGKGHIPGRCMKCYGTGRCRINPRGRPDEAVGMCPYCGGSGKGLEKCKQCN